MLGTANKSEVLLGYFTKWGDPAADLLPLAGLYKTHVRQLACALGVPETIIDKPPSAGMWPGQKDEDEIGFSYEETDPVLYRIVDLGYAPNKLKEMGYGPILINKVVKRIADNEFKRKSQLMPKLPRKIFKSIH